MVLAFLFRGARVIASSSGVQPSYCQNYQLSGGHWTSKLSRSQPNCLMTCGEVCRQEIIV